MTSNPEVSKFKAALLRQTGGGDIAVFRGAHRYQYGNGIGDILRGAWKFVVPLAMRAGKTLFKVGAQAMKEGSYARRGNQERHPTGLAVGAQARWPGHR